MPLYKVNFTDNIPVSADEVSGEINSLKEFDTVGEQTVIKWYVVQADNESNAKDIAEKLAYQIWGDILINTRTGK